MSRAQVHCLIHFDEIIFFVVRSNVTLKEYYGNNRHSIGSEIVVQPKHQGQRRHIQIQSKSILVRTNN